MRRLAPLAITLPRQFWRAWLMLTLKGCRAAFAFYCHGKRKCWDSLPQRLAFVDNARLAGVKKVSRRSGNLKTVQRGRQCFGP